MAQHQNNPSDEVDLVAEALCDAANYDDAEAEVVLWALYAMREDPTRSVAECLRIAKKEWIK